jgi:integrase
VADDFQDADGVTVLSFLQAQEKARAWFLEAHEEVTGEKVLRGPATVADAVEAYLEHLEREGKRTAKDARQRADLRILPALGSVAVEKLTRLRLEKWRDELASSPPLPRGNVKPRPEPKRPRKAKKAEKPAPKPPKTPDEKRRRKATANRILSILKAALTYAKARGLVRCPEDAWRNVKPFRAVEEARQNYLTPEEQQRLLNAIKEPDFKRLVTGALATGCRYGELARMTVGDFDPTSGTVLVQETKAGRPRRVQLVGWGRSFFEGLTAGRKRTETLFQRDQADRRTREGDPLAWGRSEQARRMHTACDAAELPRMGFHQLRHSYASALVAAGMPLAYVAKLTGHADTRMLERHYAHLAPSDLTRSLEALAPTLDPNAPFVAVLKIKKEGA